MTGMLLKKYHIAVYMENDGGFVSQIEKFLTKWYKNKVVVKTYSDAHSLFEAIHLSEISNNPFDFAVLNPTQIAEKMILQQSNPSLKFIVCSDVQSLKAAAMKEMS